MNNSESINLPELSQMREYSDIIPALEQDTGLDFSDSINNVPVEALRKIQEQSQLTARKIITTYGKYMSSEQQTWLQEMANVPVVLTRNDLNRMHMYANAAQNVQNGQEIDLKKVAVDLNQTTKEVKDFGAQASTWIPIDQDPNSRFAFYENDAYQETKNKTMWLQKTTAEELVHSLDHFELQQPFTPEQTEKWKQEIRILHEGAAETFIEEILPANTQKSMNTDALTQREVKVWKALEQDFGTENMRQLFFCGQADGTINWDIIFSRVRKYNQQFSSKK